MSIHGINTAIRDGRSDDADDTSRHEDSDVRPRQIDKRLSTYSLSLSEYMEARGSYQVYPGTEREEYDFTAERLSINSTNLVESTAHLVKGCLGAGIMSIHEGFMFAGIWTSVAFTIILGLIMSHTMMMLVNSAQKMYTVLRIPKLSYPDLLEVAVATGPCIRLRCFSKCFRYLVDFLLFIEMCGTCCIYEIMIASTVKGAMEAVSSNFYEGNYDIRLYILIITVPLLLICLIRSLKYLAPFAIIADTFVGICVIATMYYSLRQAQDVTKRPAWKNFVGLIKFCGICLYSIEGIGVTLPVENNMKTPKLFYIVVQYGMSIVVACITLTGFFGYWGWGEECRSPITILMPMTETIPIVLQFLLAIMLGITFAVNFWVPFRVIWHYIGRRYKSNRGFWERLFRMIHVSLIAAVAVGFPHLIQLIIFIGNFALAFITFVFPPLIETLVTWNDDELRTVRFFRRWRLIKNGLIMILGLSISTTTFISLGSHV